jgi:putative endonuclease
MQLRNWFRETWDRLFSYVRATARAGFHERLGRRGEQAAAAYLQRLGWRIVARGPRTRFSELDLVALDGRTVVFVEVKTRAADAVESALQAVDRGKQRRLAHAALAYLKRHGLLEQSARFDVIAVQWPAAAIRPTIEHIPNAFEPPGFGQFFG